ncbi:MAG TPA: hypothetical protein DEZ08_07035 [Dehalococcoidia bacterium]|jgi:hypothetical protein|nr:hypothetical protein [Dehalococcoidia bacterium]
MKGIWNLLFWTSFFLGLLFLLIWIGDFLGLVNMTNSDMNTPLLGSISLFLLAHLSREFK